jgi:hypothetical protein
MELMIILCAGVVIGVCAQKGHQAAVAKAYRQGRRDERQYMKNQRVQKGLEAIPVPHYTTADGHPLATVTQIAEAAKIYGKAAGRVQ